MTTEALTRAQSAIDELVRRPAAAFEEVQRRLAHVPREALQRVLADAIVAPPSGAGKDDLGGLGDLAVMLFQDFGCGAERDRLAAVVLDTARPRPLRIVAYMCVQLEDGRWFSGLLDALPEEDRTLPLEEVLEKWFTSLRDDAMGEQYAELLEEIPPPRRVGFHRRAERMRREHGVPAATVYARALASASLPAVIRDAMLVAVEHEGDESGLALLERLSRSATGATRKAMRAAVERMREQQETRPAAGGRAALSQCGGDGAAVLVVETERLGSKDVAAFAFDVERGLFGTSLERRADTAFSDHVDEWSEHGLRFTPLSPGHAAALVAEAVERRLSAGRVVSPGARGAVETVSRVPAEELPAPVAEVVDGAAIAERLRRPEFADWFLEGHELARAGLGPCAGERAAWVDDAAARLASSAVGDRLARMARGMSRWYALAGDVAGARVLAAAGRADGRVALARAIAEATFERHRAAGTGRVRRSATIRFEPYGDPELRHALRERLDVGQTATGADLARLDFAEILRIVLDHTLDSVPPGRRPSESQQVDVAVALARRAVADLERGRLPAVDPRVLDSAPPGPGFERLEPWELVQVNRHLTEGLVVFLDTTCRNCSVRCTAALGRERTAEFRAEEHPAM